MEPKRPAKQCHGCKKVTDINEDGECEDCEKASNLTIDLEQCAIVEQRMYQKRKALLLRLKNSDISEKEKKWMAWYSDQMKKYALCERCVFSGVNASFYPGALISMFVWDPYRRRKWYNYCLCSTQWWTISESERRVLINHWHLCEYVTPRGPILSLKTLL